MSTPKTVVSSPSRRVIRFFDPHFHWWDTTRTVAASDTAHTRADAPEKKNDDGTTVSGHDGGQIFVPGDSDRYGRSEYEREVASEPADAEEGTQSGCGGSSSPFVVVHEGGICIEANSVCFVDRPGSELTHMYRKELEWTLDQMPPDPHGDGNDGNHQDDAHRGERDGTEALPETPPPKTYAFVACASLESPDAESWLAELSRKRPLVCGVRQILNHEPSWPRNASLGELLTNEEWKRGFAFLVHRTGLVFDAQLNPSQFGPLLSVLEETERAFAAGPETAVRKRAAVVIDHAGTPTRSDLADPARSAAYWDGLEALAGCGLVAGIKLSMLSYTAPGPQGSPSGWDRDPVVEGAVHRIVRIFGARRVALASNAPVDGGISGWPVPAVLSGFGRVLGDRYTEEERSWLFGGAAREMYGL